MDATNTMSLNFDMSVIQQQMEAIALDAQIKAAKAVNQRKHIFAAYLNRKNAAEYLGISTTQVSKYEAQGMPVILIDGTKVYSRTAMDSWMAQHTVTM